MHTLGHIAINLAILGRKENAKYALPLVIGAVLPDIPIYLYYLYQKFVLKMPEIFIWGIGYYLPEWQTLFNTFHSFIIIFLLYFLADELKKEWFKTLFAGMILHSMFDFPVHSEDAHAHFFPVSGWKFESPVSYWNPEHYGIIGAGAEIVLVLAASIFALKTYAQKWVRYLLYGINILYLLGTAFLALYLNEII